MTTDSANGAPTGERADLLETLGKHRFFLRFTVRDLTDEQAARQTTVSELCLGGLIKHVARTEASWAQFMQGNPSGLGGGSDTTSDGAGSDGAGAADGADPYAEHANSFRMLPGETLAGLLERYDEVARQTDELVATLPDLDASYPLPAAPWFEPGARWSVRRVLLHIIAETSQHAGHADILREAIDGAKSMG